MRDRGHRNKVWIKIQRLTKPVYDYDNYPAEWDDVYELRALVEPSSSSETVEGSQQITTSSLQVTIRYQPDIVAGMRVLVDDETLDASLDSTDSPIKRVLNIVGIVDTYNRNRDLIMDCTESKI